VIKSGKLLLSLGELLRNSSFNTFGRKEEIRRPGTEGEREGVRVNGRVALLWAEIRRD